MIRLLELRKESGLSQRQMAKEFKISQATYNNWENENTQPSIEQLAALANFFDVSTDFLIGNADEFGNRKAAVKTDGENGVKTGNTISYNGNLPAEEAKKFLSEFSALDEFDRRIIIMLMEELIKKQKQ